MSVLFSPYDLAGTTLKNRIVISPMCQYSASEGMPNNWHLVHLGARAIGGAALVMQEATAVSPEGRITYADLGIWNDQQVDKYAEIVAFLHSQNALAGIQIAHAGRKASREVPWKGGNQIAENSDDGWQTLGPSAIAFSPESAAPKALSIEDIEEITKDFILATKRAQRAFYDVLEIHGAHGYLFHQFLSPLSNTREDQYGGSFENRVRFLLEVTRAVREIWVGKPLLVRISATDYVEGGWTIEDSVRLSKLLKEEGVDLIDVSSGGNVPDAKIPNSPGYQVPFAARIKSEVQIPTAAVGLITSAQQAESILEKNEADLIFIARESLRNPNFPLDAAQELGSEISWPSQYERAKL